ncbi:MAG: glyceraldehyde 3-phosphate dehydrogenase [Bacillota bacterium]|nr:MAG: glyceraldehyde 3-phosphate dehydrogenase [Bacillota bacterium]MBS3949466.1 type I glyceraldehyde-3-phosphate dehydrogenase [Peptococcaceae bacterium]
MRIAINGFGRIGRQVFRIAHNRPELEIVAINDLADPKALAHLLKYDSNYGRFEADVQPINDGFEVNGKKVKVFAERDPAKLPWSDLGIDVVVECTGLFKERKTAGKHIEAGAKKVLISSPAKDEDITIVLGCNEDKYDHAKHHIISNASCTTNALGPMAKVLHEEFGIVKGLMNTIHAFTNDQRILDVVHSDLRRARTASQSIIPTTTGAAKAIGLVLPELKGKLNGFALRVPTTTVSIVDLTVELAKQATSEMINDAFRRAANGKLKGILGVSDEPLVSIDYLGDTRSSIVDMELTMVVGDNMAKVCTWYDNEWGYSCRMVDVLSMIANQA